MKETHNWYDKRIIKKFAFLPISTRNEMRYFEFVILEQQYLPFEGWCNIKFLDKEKQKCKNL